MKQILVRGLAASLLALSAASTFSSAALAQSAGWDIFHGAPKFKDANGNELKIRGRILWDAAWLEETKKSSGQTTDTDANEFRAARIGFEGKYDETKFKFEVDFAGSQIEVKDAMVTYTALPVDITVGQFKTANSLEEITSARFNTFIERAAFTDAFGLDRRVGVALGQNKNTYSWEAGVFRNSIADFNADKSANTVYAARGTYNPVKDKDMLVHLGASMRYTDKENAAQPSRSSRWGAHLATEKVKPVIGANALLLGAEAAVINGPFYAQAEYMTEEGDRGSADGYYVSGGFFLTGESLGYKNGAFDRTKLNAPLSKGGLGAFEIAARYDVIDATSASDEKSSAATLGLVWHAESHLRVRAEYIAADADTYDASGFQLRTQIDW